MTASHAASRRATPRRGASSWPRPRPPAWTSQRTTHPLLGRDGETLAMDVVRDGPADARGAADRQQRLPRRRGLLRLGRADRAAARRRAGAPRRARAGVAVLYIHALNPLRLLVAAPHHARERRPEPQLPRLQPAAAAQPGLRRDRRTCWCPPHWPPTRRGRRPRWQRYVAAHGVRGAAGRPSPAASTTTPRACSTAAATRPGASRRCATCCRTTASAASAWAGSTCTPAWGPAATASASSPAATTPRRWRARAPGGATQVTSIYDGISTSALLTGLMWLAAYEECPQAEYTGIALEYGTVPLERGDRRAARRPVAGEPPRGRRRAQRARDQAPDARRLLHRHRRLEAARSSSRAWKPRTRRWPGWALAGRACGAAGSVRQDLGQEVAACARSSGALKNSCGVFCSTIWPWSMKITRSATALAKPISCVTHSMVMPWPASSIITSSTSLIISGSSAEVGSSNSMILGVRHSARAMATRCCWPPESCSGYLLRLLGDAHALELLHGAFFGLLLGHLADPHRRQRQVLQHRQVREQVELLEHHADLLAHLRRWP